MNQPEGPAETMPVDAHSQPPERKLAWWFSVYSSTVLICIIWETVTHWIRQPLSNIFFILPEWVLNIVFAPLGLLPTFGYIAEWVAERNYGSGPKIEDIVEMLCPLSYIVFLVHLTETKHAKTRRAFMMLMVSLVLLTSASMVGCSKEMGTIDIQH